MAAVGGGLLAAASEIRCTFSTLFYSDAPFPHPVIYPASTQEDTLILA